MNPNPHRLGDGGPHAAGVILSEPTNTPPAPEVSPTGKPLVPPSWVPYVASLLALAGAASTAPEMGVNLPPAVVLGAKVVARVATLLLGMSPGLRKV